MSILKRMLAAAVLFVVAVAVLLLWIHRDAPVPHDRELARLCSAAYVAAQTAADSAAVDPRRPVLSRAQAPAALRCGALRQAGRL